LIVKSSPAIGAQLRDALEAEDDRDHDGQQPDDRQSIDSGFLDMPGNGRQPQATRVRQRVGGHAGRPPDEADDVECVLPRVDRAFAEPDDQLAPPGTAVDLRQWLELQATHKIQQRFMLGPDARQFHALVAQLAQQQRARRIEAAQFAKIEPAAHVTRAAASGIFPTRQASGYPVRPRSPIDRHQR
jgi:hypothetical protein